MRAQLQFGIGLVKPTKARIFRRVVKATDKAWREAIFGMGGSRKRIAGARIGPVDGQPLAVIVELQSECSPGTACWTIRTDKGLFAFAGPGAVYNDAGFGPATLALPLERLEAIVEFDPDPKALEEGLRRTLESRSPDNAPASTE